MFEEGFGWLGRHRIGIQMAVFISYMTGNLYQDWPKPLALMGQEASGKSY
jgi:hypothetical protein